MSRVLGIDTETTGLDLSTDRVIELGVCLGGADLQVARCSEPGLMPPEREHG